MHSTQPKKFYLSRGCCCQTHHREHVKLWNPSGLDNACHTSALLWRGALMKEKVIYLAYFCLTAPYSPILCWIAAKLHIGSILASVKSGLSHFHWVFLVLDRFLQICYELLLNRNVLADLQRCHNVCHHDSHVCITC